MFSVIKLTKFFVINVFFILFSLSAIANLAPNTQPIVGYWQTIDGKTKKPSSVIEIQQVKQIFEGKIFKTYSVQAPGVIERCTMCTGMDLNKPILGLVIIKNMTCGSKSCKGGTILDPRNGKVYHATMKLVQNGLKLRVRGYIGTPLFGKTVVWHRTDKNGNSTTLSTTL